MKPLRSKSIVGIIELTLILTLGCLTSQGQSRNISVLAGTPQRTRVLKTSGLPAAPKTILWKTKSLFDYRPATQRGSNTGAAWVLKHYPTLTPPIAADGVLYFTFGESDSSVFAIDSNTGKRLVVLTFRKTKVSDPTASGSVVFFGTESGSVRAYDIKKRSDLWMFEEKGESFSDGPPMFDGELVYVLGRKGSLYAIEAETGKLKWKYKSGPSLRSPAIDGNRVIVVSIEGSLMALDRNTGSTLWQVPIDSNSGPPSILDEQIFLVHKDRDIQAYSIADGSLKWKSKHSGGAGTELVLFNKTVYYGGPENNIIGLDSATGSEKLRFKTVANCRNPLIAGDLLYVGCEKKRLYALDPSTLEQKWVLENKQDGPPPPVFLDGVMYFLASDGHMYAMK